VRTADATNNAKGCRANHSGQLKKKRDLSTDAKHFSLFRIASARVNS
jgi:hypothetical protein